MEQYLKGWSKALLGLGTVSLWAIAPLTAIASPIAAPQTMTQLNLPELETPVAVSPMATEPLQVADRLPAPRLSDVSPNHWAYPAIMNLVDAYGCLSGYPDGAFRGDQTLTRYEFAAAMSTCLNVFMELVEQERGINLNRVLTDLISLQEELGRLGGSVESIEDTHKEAHKK